MPSDYARILEENLQEYGRGTRHLEFFRRLYADKTHFIFELLQNAEDAKAHSVRFDLYAERLEVRHDGRQFNEKDVRGVCGVGEGTKAEDLTQIGKFGIGFKSVYAYTDCPEVHSGDEHFCIRDYVRPHAVKACDPGEIWTTLFIFPLANSLQGAAEIESRLQTLDVRSLLFLRNVTRVEWAAGQVEGRYSREVKPRGRARHVCVIHHQIGRQEWLVFERPVATPDKSATLKVEVAFCIEREDKTGVDRIVPVDQSPLVVFFPTEKETHLGFLVQGPYRTTPTRENIPANDQWNQHLVSETAALVAKTLPSLREMQLLTVSVLEAMPIESSHFVDGSLFRPVFESVREMIATQPLLPAHGGEFVTARSAKLARGAAVRELLSDSQLCDLLGDDAGWRWVSGEITYDKTRGLRDYLVDDLGIEEITPEVFARRFNANFIARQTDEWVIKLYQFLDGQKTLWKKAGWRGDSTGPLRNSPFLRIQNGDPLHVPPFGDDDVPSVYLPLSTGDETDYPTVKRELVADETAQQFLKNLGLTEPSAVTEVLEKVLPKYRAEGSDSKTLTVTDHAQDIAKILRACESASQRERDGLIKALKEASFLHAEIASKGASKFARPDQIYVRSPELEIYFDGNSEVYFLSAEYPEDQTNALCRLLGVSRHVRIRQRSPNSYSGHVQLPGMGKYYYVRGMHGFDPDASVDGLRHALEHCTIEKAAYIWNALLIPHRQLVRGQVQSATRSDFDPATTREQVSAMGRLVREVPWLPGPDTIPRKPSEMSLEDLPQSFERDDELGRALEMKPSASDPVQALAKETGLTVDDIEYLRANLQEFQEWRTQRSRPPFPVREPVNPAIRAERVRKQAKDATLKEYERRERSVRTSDDVQTEAKIYLRDLYTNNDGHMVCQICREEMPFKLDDEEYYFEAVECLKNAGREHRENHLALCPICAAKYRYANGATPEQLREGVLHAGALEVSLTLAREAHTIGFVGVHLQDLQAVIGGDADDVPGVAS